jgi:hypothetical protein
MGREERMKRPTIASQILMLLILIVGVLIGTALVGVATWGDLETVLFFPPTGADKHLTNLQCPILISTNETGMVSVNLKNPSTYTVNPIVRATISQGSALTTEDFSSQPTMPPGGSQKLTWPVVAKEAAYRGALILVQVYVNGSYPLPSRVNTCGIVVMNLGNLKGNLVVIGALFLSLAGMLGGGVWWLRTHRSLPGQRDTPAGGIIFLVVVVILGIIACLLGLWPLGLGSFLLSILLIVILLARFGMDVRD